MPRYVVERTFPDGLSVPMNDVGADALGGVIMRNAEKGVTWVQSFVSPDKKQSFCIYDAPSPEAIRSHCPEKRASGRQDHGGAGS